MKFRIPIPVLPLAFVLGLCPVLSSATQEYHFEFSYDGPWQWREVEMTHNDEGPTWSDKGTAIITGCSEQGSSIAVPETISWSSTVVFEGVVGIDTIHYEYTVDIIGLDDDAFANHTELEEVFIPDCVTNIPNGLFDGCSNLKKTNIPDCVTNIGDYAFYDCSSLTPSTFPAT